MLTAIEQAIPTLSPAERNVALWVLAHPGEAAAATVADVATAAGTSQPTVVRFCRSVGANGFRDLKMHLAAAVGGRTSFVHADVAPDDGAVAAAHKVVNRSIRALDDLRGQLDAMPFDAAVEVLGSARQIVFAGLGASGDVARDAAQKFFRLGIPCVTATDAPAILQQGAVATELDAFVAISRTGSWPSLVNGCRRAAANGAAVIAVAPETAPLAVGARHVFRLSVAEDPGIYTPMSGRLAQLALLDALQVALAIHLGDAAEARLGAAKAALAEFRERGEAY